MGPIKAVREWFRKRRKARRRMEREHDRKVRREREQSERKEARRETMQNKAVAAPPPE